MNRLLPALAAAATVLVAYGTASARPMLKKEPGIGQMKLGQIVLADDGRCPKGQVTRVAGDTMGGDRTARQMRQRSCMPPP